MSWVLKEFQKTDEQKKSGDILCVMGRINCLFHKLNERAIILCTYMYIKLRTSSIAYMILFRNWYNIKFLSVFFLIFKKLASLNVVLKNPIQLRI